MLTLLVVLLSLLIPFFIACWIIDDTNYDAKLTTLDNGNIRATI